MLGFCRAEQGWKVMWAQHADVFRRYIKLVGLRESSHFLLQPFTLYRNQENCEHSVRLQKMTLSLVPGGCFFLSILHRPSPDNIYLLTWTLAIVWVGVRVRYNAASLSRWIWTAITFHKANRQEKGSRCYNYYQLDIVLSTRYYQLVFVTISTYYWMGQWSMEKNIT